MTTLWLLGLLAVVTVTQCYAPHQLFGLRKMPEETDAPDARKVEAFLSSIQDREEKMEKDLGKRERELEMMVKEQNKFMEHKLRALREEQEKEKKTGLAAAESAGNGDGEKEEKSTGSGATVGIVMGSLLGVAALVAIVAYVSIPAVRKYREGKGKGGGVEGGGAEGGAERGAGGGEDGGKDGFLESLRAHQTLSLRPEPGRTEPVTLVRSEEGTPVGLKTGRTPKMEGKRSEAKRPSAPPSYSRKSGRRRSSNDRKPEAEEETKDVSTTVKWSTTAPSDSTAVHTLTSPSTAIAL